MVKNDSCAWAICSFIVVCAFKDAQFPLKVSGLSEHIEPLTGIVLQVVWYRSGYDASGLTCDTTDALH